MKSFSGKVALVTGGSSGIGRATALAFAREGAKVVIADIDVAGGEQTLRMVKEAGGEGKFIKTDVRIEQEVEAVVGKAVEIYGWLDCGFNNAGIGSTRATTVSCTEENWDNVMNTNLKGVWLCMKYEIRQMLKQGGGAIVNTASIQGLVGDGSPAYTASKHGVVGLTKAAALEHARSGIRINSVCPGIINTPLVERVVQKYPELEQRLLAREPVGRFGRPEEIAEAALWLLSDKASFVTGHAMVVDGGAIA